MAYVHAEDMEHVDPDVQHHEVDDMDGEPVDDLEGLVTSRENRNMDFDITFHTQEIGVHLGKMHRVLKITRKSPAHARVRRMDRIVMVGGANVENHTVDELVELLQTVPRPVDIRFRRKKKPNKRRKNAKKRPPGRPKKPRPREPKDPAVFEPQNWRSRYVKCVRAILVRDGAIGAIELRGKVEKWFVENPQPNKESPVATASGYIDNGDFNLARLKNTLRFMISRSQLLHHRGLYVLQKFSKAGRPHGFRYSDTIYNSVPENGSVTLAEILASCRAVTGTKKDFDFKLFYDALKEHMRGGRIIKTTMDQRSYYSKCTAKEARFLYDQRPRKIAPWGKAKAFKKASAKLSQILEESDNQMQELEVDPDRVIKENALKTQEQEGIFELCVKLLKNVDKSAASTDDMLSVMSMLESNVKPSQDQRSWIVEICASLIKHLNMSDKDQLLTMIGAQNGVRKKTYSRGVGTLAGTARRGNCPLPWWYGVLPTKEQVREAQEKHDLMMAHAFQAVGITQAQWQEMRGIFIAHNAPDRATGRFEARSSVLSSKMNGVQSIPVYSSGLIAKVQEQDLVSEHRARRESQQNAAKNSAAASSAAAASAASAVVRGGGHQTVV